MPLAHAAGQLLPHQHGHAGHARGRPLLVRRPNPESVSRSWFDHSCCRLDVGLSLRTALVNPDGSLVLDARRIVDASARGWLAYDLASIVPWDALVVCAYAARGVAPSTLALKVAKLPRLLRVRLLRPLLRAAAALPLGRLAQLLCGFLLLAHWGACAMWTISRWQVEHAPGCGVNPDTGLLPMALVDQRRGVTYTTQQDAHQAAVRSICVP